jgi:hypothetical protein
MRLEEKKIPISLSLSLQALALATRHVVRVKRFSYDLQRETNTRQANSADAQPNDEKEVKLLEHFYAP